MRMFQNNLAVFHQLQLEYNFRCYRMFRRILCNCKMTRPYVIYMMCLLLPAVTSSAIPMWEYLSRGEKMSHLFNMFVQQVEKYCSNNPEPDCSKILLVYGLTNLAKMGDESLDDMDPYQRGANEIVWDSMMKGKHDHKKPESGSSLEAEDMVQGAASNIDEEDTTPQSFLLGPMVVRVLPNGLPIPGEKNDLPKDEDVEEFVPKSSSPSTTTITTTTRRPPPPPTTNPMARKADFNEQYRNYQTNNLYKYHQYSRY